MNCRAAAVLFCALSACTVGPRYRAPPLPDLASYAESDAQNYTGAAPLDAYWTTFDDAALSELVERALALNTDLRAAVARIDQAAALSRLATWELVPSVTANASYSHTRLDAAAAPGRPRAQRDIDVYQASVRASWEIDLFGRVRRGVMAARADQAARTADFLALRVSVAAEVARTYFELRGAQEELAVALNNAKNQDESLQLTEVRLEAGSGTEFDTARARAQLESTRARVPALEVAIANACHRLAVLDGQMPSELLQRLMRPQRLPTLPSAVAIGAPADLLRRRPDVAAAERRLAAATARIGISTADLFPRLSALGLWGSAAATVHDLWLRDSEFYAIAPTIDWAFLDVGRVRARIAASRADAAVNLALYQGTVLAALEEAENALIAYSRARDALEYFARAAAASREAAELARARFEGGTADFLQVLDAERSQLEFEDSLAQARLQSALALVAVYRALAGGDAGPQTTPVATGLSR